MGEGLAILQVNFCYENADEIDRAVRNKAKIWHTPNVSLHCRLEVFHKARPLINGSLGFTTYGINEMAKTGSELEHMSVWSNKLVKLAFAQGLPNNLAAPVKGKACLVISRLGEVGLV